LSDRNLRQFDITEFFADPGNFLQCIQHLRERERERGGGEGRGRGGGNKTITSHIVQSERNPTEKNVIKLYQFE